VLRQIICAIDTGDLDTALGIVRRLSPQIGAFKIGHALTLPHGLEVISRLQDAGAQRIFLDLKFHDIPNSVALAVREAARRHVWMTTLHISGGAAMLTAAVEEARSAALGEAPLLVGVSVLTSLSQQDLNQTLGIHRTIADHMKHLTEVAMDSDLDGVVCSPEEIGLLRPVVGHGIIVTPGIRFADSASHDQVRTGTPHEAIQSGADYLVIGRMLIDSPDVDATLARLGLVEGAI
jgi:orotidine-5'-phosphate decarboxylase